MNDEGASYTCEHCRLPIWNKIWIQFHRGESNYFHLHLHCYQVSGKYEYCCQSAAVVVQEGFKHLKPPKIY